MAVRYGVPDLNLALVLQPTYFTMNKQPIHQNMNTSFVNVAALVRYLRHLQFVCSVRIELSSYEADIVFTGSKKVRAREYDHIAGRISHGEHALKRILIRAKEPHGRIHVYKSLDASTSHDGGSVFVDKSIMTNAREMAASAGGTTTKEQNLEFILSTRDGENALVLAALSEFLREIDRGLAKGKLSLSAAFRNACNEIAAAYPFMKQSRGTMIYRDGEIHLTETADPGRVAEAVFAALLPIFNRLRSDRKYDELVRLLTEKLRESSAERRSEYVRLGLMRHIEELLDGGA